MKRICNWCEDEFLVYKSQVKRGRGKFCSNSCKASFRNTTDNPAWRPEVRLKISLNHADVSGENNPMYGRRGILSPGYIDGRNSISGDIWRKIAFVNKPKRCEICGKKAEGRNIQVHHKDKNGNNNDLENLQVVCSKCHSLLHPKKRDSLGRFIKEVV